MRSLLRPLLVRQEQLRGGIVVSGSNSPSSRHLVCSCHVDPIYPYAPGTRPMSALYEHCKVQGVPVFIKQDVARFPGQQGRIPDWLWNVTELPLGIRWSRQKKAA